MIYLHDPENPFQKILVKNDRDLVGIVRRNLKTGYYQFYDSKTDSVTPLFRAGRLDQIKSWVKTQYAA